MTQSTMSISVSPNSSREAWSALKGTGRPMLARCVAPKSSAEMMAKFWVRGQGWGLGWEWGEGGGVRGEERAWLEWG